MALLLLLSAAEIEFYQKQEQSGMAEERIEVQAQVQNWKKTVRITVFAINTVV